MRDVITFPRKDISLVEKLGLLKSVLRINPNMNLCVRMWSPIYLKTDNNQSWPWLQSIWKKVSMRQDNSLSRHASCQFARKTVSFEAKISLQGRSVYTAGYGALKTRPVGISILRHFATRPVTLRNIKINRW